jgi:non-canonical purine NTP pyrophosphatase (RdgB/HAM1 family)
MMLNPSEPLIIATHNPGKLAEIRQMLAPYGLTVRSAGELGISEPEETETSFAKNAALKARHSALAAHFPALADDSGLVIPAIGGAPGVYSARWAGAGKDFTVAFARIEAELAKHNAPKNAPAYFVCALALSLPDGNVHFFEGRIDGHLVFPPRGDLGFGYDPIFVPEGYDITFGEMNPDEKNRISHRARAFAKFEEYLKARVAA